MKLNKVLSLVCVTLCIYTVFAQNTKTVSDSAAAVSSGIWGFSLELLAKTAREAGNMNMFMSPLNIWTMLVILKEGSRGATSDQLKNTLRIPENDVFKDGYKAISSAIASNTNGVELDTTNVLFTNNNKQLLKDFQARIFNQFKVGFLPVNFRNVGEAIQIIDSFVAKATRNRVTRFVQPEDVQGAQLLLMTAIFFKGQWNIPFNRSATFDDTFYDDNMKPVGKVKMMYQIASFPYVMLGEMQGHAVELPYGKDEKYSMIVILPKKNVPLQSLLEFMATMPAHKLLNDLESSREEYYDDVIHVYLPRFTISSDYTMNVILEKMGIMDLFNSNLADLHNMSPENFFLSRVIHKAEIEVNEEGTVASAVTGGTIAYRAPPPKFYANRPFAYLIVEKTTRTILFAGKMCNTENL